MTLKIYGVLRSRASRNVWLAKELGIAYELVPTIQSYRLADPAAPDAPFNTATPAFRAINPDGLIPCIDDDGFVLTESLAINLYLARKHGGPLAPANIHEEAQMMSWSLWAAANCETHTLSILVNRVSRPPEQRSAEAVEAALGALARPFASLEKTLAAGAGTIVGGRFTVVDINVAEVVRYAQAAPELIDAHPAIKAWLGACQGRPAFRDLMREREMEPA